MKVRSARPRELSRALLVLSFALALAGAALGCEDEGGDGDSAPLGASPGQGTGQLSVNVTLTAQEVFPNASRRTDLDTHLTVTVRRHGVAIPDATVVFSSDSGDKVLLGDESGTYRGSHAGYHRTYGFLVEAPPDSVSDVVIVGPELHTLSAPDPERPRRVGDDIPVRWETLDEAESVRVRLGSYDAQNLPDTGEHLIPGDGERSGSDLRVEVRRQVRMGLAGGAVGSEVLAELRNRTAPLLFCVSGEDCPPED